MAHSINQDCIQCGACQAECPHEAIDEIDGEYVVNARRCRDCGTCTFVCPTGAIGRQIQPLVKAVLR